MITRGVQRLETQFLIIAHVLASINTAPIAMESLIGITGRDFILLASDAQSLSSILIQKPSGVDRHLTLTPHCVLTFSGEHGDSVQFGEYVQRNVRLYGIRTGLELTPWACANFVRKELAEALRSRVRQTTYRMNPCDSILTTVKHVT